MNPNEIRINLDYIANPNEVKTSLVFTKTDPRSCVWQQKELKKHSDCGKGILLGKVTEGETKFNAYVVEAEEFQTRPIYDTIILEYVERELKMEDNKKLVLVRGKVTVL